MKSQDKYLLNNGKLLQKFNDSDRRKSDKYEHTKSLVLNKLNSGDCDEDCEIGKMCEHSVIKSLKDINPKLKFKNQKSRKYKISSSMSSDYYNVKDAYYTQQVHLTKKADSGKITSKKMMNKLDVPSKTGQLSFYNIGSGVKSNLKDNASLIGERNMSETSIDTYSHTKTTTDNQRKLVNNIKSQNFQSIKGTHTCKSSFHSNSELAHIPKESPGMKHFNADRLSPPKESNSVRYTIKVNEESNIKSFTAEEFKNIHSFTDDFDISSSIPENNGSDEFQISDELQGIMDKKYFSNPTKKNNSSKLMSLSKIVPKKGDPLENRYKSPENMSYNDCKGKSSPHQCYHSTACCKSEAKNREFFTAIREEMGEEICTSERCKSEIEYKEYNTDSSKGIPNRKLSSHSIDNAELRKDRSNTQFEEQITIDEKWVQEPNKPLPAIWENFEDEELVKPLK